MDFDDYREGPDIRSFCNALKEAWLCVPDKQFDEMLMLVFGGADLSDLSGPEMQEIINDFILQNE